MANKTLNAELGYMNLANSWFEVPANSIQQIGLNSPYNYLYAVGCVVYPTKEMRYARITKAILKAKLELQASLPASTTATLYTNAFYYSELVTSLPIVHLTGGYTNQDLMKYSKSGIDRWAQIIEIDVTSNASAIQTLDKTVMTLFVSMGGDLSNRQNMYLNVNYAETTLYIEYEPYTLPTPSNFSPTSGIFNPAGSITASWQYNPSQSVNDAQTGSILEYSINNAAWVQVTKSGSVNTHTFPANTFPQGASVRFRVKTISTVGESDYTSVYTVTMAATHPPDTLSPNGVNRNPAAAITCTWQYVKSEYSADAQTGSVLRYRIGTGAWTNVTLNNNLNTHTFAARAFTDGQVITWQVQTISNVGTSAWSAEAKFTLASTAPLASVLVFPINVSVIGTNGVMLEWLYNSPYDTKPSRFDIQYRVDGIEWVEFSNTGQLSAMTEPITTQSRVEWQVRAYGELGDIGPWSDIGVFFTIGVPNAPTIVSVTNNNRPTISFSAQNMMSWELQVLSGGNVIYDTGSMAFMDDFSHRMNGFIANGNYVVRMRIFNVYGLASDWAELAFTINTETPEALKLRIANNPQYAVELRFNNDIGKLAYIYRSEFENDTYLRIGKTTSSQYYDFTVRPNQRYKYFIRSVTETDSFADSNTVTGAVNYLETTLAVSSKPGDILMFLHQINDKPNKDINFSTDKSLTQFIGRSNPVLQTGILTSRNATLSFYCTIADFERLEELTRSTEILIIRDWRIGAVYGTINGAIQARRENDGMCVVSFTFTRADYAEEVPLE